MKKLLSILAVSASILALSACGGGGGSYDSGTTPPPSSSTPGADGFFNEVMRILGMTSESSEPEAVESVTVTSPEDAEPAPVS
jgi:predicted small lipoprotein YifL